MSGLSLALRRIVDRTPAPEPPRAEEIQSAPTVEPVPGELPEALAAALRISEPPAEPTATDLSAEWTKILATLADDVEEMNASRDTIPLPIVAVEPPTSTEDESEDEPQTTSNAVIDAAVEALISYEMIDDAPDILTDPVEADGVDETDDSPETFVMFPSADLDSFAELVDQSIEPSPRILRGPIPRATIPFSPPPAIVLVETCGSEYRRLADRVRDEEPTARVLAFITVGTASDRDFSLPQLARAFVELKLGDVTLIDGASASERSWRGVATGSGLGLADVLRGEATWEDASRMTTIAGVTIVGCGTPLESTDGDSSAADDADEAAELEQGAWRSLREACRFALLDAGLADDPRALHLAAQADATYLVVRLGQVSRAELARLAADYRAAGVELRGGVAVAA